MNFQYDLKHKRFDNTKWREKELQKKLEIVLGVFSLQREVLLSSSWANRRSMDYF